MATLEELVSKIPSEKIREAIEVFFHHPFQRVHLSEIEIEDRRKIPDSDLLEVLFTIIKEAYNLQKIAEFRGYEDNILIDIFNTLEISVEIN